jgi:hypothetical protein
MKITYKLPTFLAVSNIVKFKSVTPTLRKTGMHITLSPITAGNIHVPINYPYLVYKKLQ